MRGNANSSIVPSFDNLKIGVGAGIRYLTPVGPIRLDVAVPLSRGTGDRRSEFTSGSASRSRRDQRGDGMRRVLRYVLIAIVAVVVLAGLALATPFGRGIVVSQIQRGAAGAGLVVSIEGASGWPPFTLGASRITIADADGVFAEIDNLGVNIKTTALLVGQISFDSLYAERIAVTRQPHLAGGGSEGAALPFARMPCRCRAWSSAPISPVGRRAGADRGAFQRCGRAAFGQRQCATDRRTRGGRWSHRSAARVRRRRLPRTLNLPRTPDGILTGLIGRTSGPGYRLQAKSTVDGDATAGSLSLFVERRGALCR